jgi:hypothetical protein
MQAATPSCSRPEWYRQYTRSASVDATGALAAPLRFLPPSRRWRQSRLTLPPWPPSGHAAAISAAITAYIFEAQGCCKHISVAAWNP